MLQAQLFAQWGMSSARFRDKALCHVSDVGPIEEAVRDHPLQLTSRCLRLRAETLSGFDATAFTTRARHLKRPALH
jgi:hypothetical protein